MISTLPLNKQCVFWKLGRLKVWQIQEINFPLKFSRVGRMLKMPRDTVRISESKSFFLIWNQSHFPKVRRISVRLCGEIKVEVIDWNKHCSWIRYYFIFAFITRYFFYFKFLDIFWFCFPFWFIWHYWPHAWGPFLRFLRTLRSWGSYCSEFDSEKHQVCGHLNSCASP